MDISAIPDANLFTENKNYITYRTKLHANSLLQFCVSTSAFALAFPDKLHRDFNIATP